MNTFPNRLLWRFADATAPAQWASKQARRIYDAAMRAEKNGDWMRHAVPGTVKVLSTTHDLPALKMPEYGGNACDEFIGKNVRSRANELRALADKMERELENYGPGRFRKQRVAVQAPLHPFDAEKAILGVLNRPDADEIWVNGAHFVRDASGSFAEKTPAETA